MTKKIPRGILLLLSLALVVGLVLAGCGKGKEAALQEPGLELSAYERGSTVDFDEATINILAATGGEGGFKYEIMKAIYPTVWASNADNVARTLFPPPYWKGDGQNTTYAFLTNGDKMAVDAAIFAALPPEEQQQVVAAVDGLFDRQAQDTGGARPLEENQAFQLLMGQDGTGYLAGQWKTDATAWMAALNAKAAADYGGQTYSHLTLTQKAGVTASMTVIEPELALYRAMVQSSFRNGLASATYPDKAETAASTVYGKAYAALIPLVEAPVVDAVVWGQQLTAAEQAMVNNRVTGLFDLAAAQASDNVPLTSNVYYGILLVSPGAGQAAADAWAGMVTPSTPGTGAEATAFYTILGGGNPVAGQAAFKEGLARQYYGDNATYAALSAASQGVIDLADNSTAGLSTVQRLPALPLDQNQLYSTLNTEVGAAAAAGWAIDAANGKNAISAASLREWAFYKWMAYENLRNATAARLYPTQVAEMVAAARAGGAISASTYAACNALEQAVVNGMVWAALGSGEQSYVTDRALPGMFGLIQAEMTDAVTLDQSICYLTLAATTATSAAGFKQDVEQGHEAVKTAFYRWLAKEQVKEMRDSAVMIQQSVGVFTVKITNPNEYAIRVNQMDIAFRTTAGASADVVDVAEASVEDVWVPARADGQDGEVSVKVLAPIKAYDVLTWLVTGPKKDSATARQMAQEVFSKIQAGTVVWTYTADLEVSHGSEIIRPKYPQERAGALV